MNPLADKSKADREYAKRLANERAERRVKIRAARLRLTTDRRLGLETPDWVKELAGKSL